ncbi:Protein of unknown function, partial [Gryllus bimaculatus]
EEEEEAVPWSISGSVSPPPGSAPFRPPRPSPRRRLACLTRTPAAYRSALGCEGPSPKLVSPPYNALEPVFKGICRFFSGMIFS